MSADGRWDLIRCLKGYIKDQHEVCYNTAHQHNALNFGPILYITAYNGY